MFPVVERARPKGEQPPLRGLRRLDKRCAALPRSRWRTSSRSNNIAFGTAANLEDEVAGYAVHNASTATCARLPRDIYESLRGDTFLLDREGSELDL
jgi:hypothetical protein